MNHRHLHAFAMLLAVSGCAAGREPHQQQHSALEDELEPLTQMATAPEWEDMGALEVMPEGTPSVHVPDTLPEVAPDVARRLAQQPPILAVDDLRNKRRYKLKFPADWRPDYPAESGSSDLDLDGDLVLEGDAESLNKGWSDNDFNGFGDDNRTNRSAGNASIYRRIGQIGVICSGTMIRHTVNGTFALTAAHCVFDVDGNPIREPFEPARGSAHSTGAWDIIDAIYYNNFLVNDCASNLTRPCAQWDIALLRLTPRAGTTYLGGVTYGHRNPATLSSTATHYHRGYPNCHGPGDPSTGCVPSTLWGDNYHTVGDFSYSNRVFGHSSDVSGGHSGGPHYYFDSASGLNANIVWGVAVAHECVGVCTLDPHQPLVNFGRRIDQYWYDAMYYFING